MSSNADKRRRARIQGGCNTPSLAPTRGRAPPPPTRVEAKKDGFDATVLGTANLDEAMIGKPVSQSAFMFEETDQHVVKRKPPVKDIMKEGKHVLSAEPSGESVLYFYPNFMDEELGNVLYLDILHGTRWETKQVRRRGESFDMPRKVAWYGELPYSYSGATMESNNVWPDSVKNVLEAVQRKLKESPEFDGSTEFNSVLLNFYEDEHNHVAWHSDDELEMKVNSTIASVSLGGTRMFEMRKKPDEGEDFEYVQQARVKLDHASLMVMDGHTQQDWQHRVPKEFNSRKPRINLTFRTIVPREN